MQTVVIGAGRMGFTHLRAVRAAGLTIAAVADLRQTALDQAAEEFGLESTRLYTDPAKAIRDTRAPLVIIATTAPGHCDLTCAAAGAGASHVLCEKPMAVSLTQCERMLRTCADAGTRLAINHPMRFMPVYALPRQRLESAEYGGFRSATVIGGNCGMAMVVSHKLEMLRWFAGAEPARVQAWLDPDQLGNPRGEQFFDRGGAMRVVTENGRRLYVDISTDQGHGMTSIYAGRHGTLTVDEMTGSITENHRQAREREKPSHQYWCPFESTQTRVPPAESLAPAKAVLAALLKGEDYPSGREAVATIRALVAAHVSSEDGGRSVRVDGPLPTDREFPWA